MPIKIEDICDGVEYLWRRTDGWDWFGEERWWEIFVMFNGRNGTGGACMVECWKWNGSSQTLRHDYRNLTIEQTCKVVEEIIHASEHGPRVLEGFLPKVLDDGVCIMESG